MKTLRLRNDRSFRDAHLRKPAVPDGQLELGIELPTVKDYAERFLAWRTDPRNPRRIRSWRAERSNFRKHIVPEFGALRLHEVTRQHVDAWLRQLMTQMEPKSAHNILVKLSVFFEEAMFDFEGQFPEGFRNPADLPKSRRPPRSDAKFLANEHVFTKSELMTLCSSPRVDAIYRVRYAFMALTGCRPGEASGVRAKHIEDARPLRRLVVKEQLSKDDGFVERTKTQVVRHVPIHPELDAMLEQWSIVYRMIYGVALEGDALLFPSRRPRPPHPHLVPMRTGAFLDALRRHLAALEMPKRRAHDWRRTFSTICDADGVPERAVNRMAWTTRKDMQDHYVETSWKSLCVAIRRVEISLPKLF